MKKFDTLLEGVFQRFQGGGYLTGDLVKLKEGLVNSDWYTSRGENTKEAIKKFMEADLNIRVSAVKTLRPQVQTSIDQGSVSDEYIADIALETAPGMFTQYLEIPCEFLEQIDTGINLSPIPDSQKRESDITIKPEPVEEEETEGMPGTENISQTRMEGGDNDLPEDNTTLPGATGANSYTGGYMS